MNETAPPFRLDQEMFDALARIATRFLSLCVVLWFGHHWIPPEETSEPAPVPIPARGILPVQICHVLDGARTTLAPPPVRFTPAGSTIL
jgi:hypothetical protein